MANYKFRADITKFDTTTTRYTGENALVLVDCARLAYEEKEVIEQAMTKQWRFKNFKFFNAKSTQAFVAGNDAMIIVAFRGTEGKWADLKSDAKTIPVDRTFGTVHHGFNDALHEVWGDQATKENIRDYINQFQDDNQSVWFCGHSLGAALATLATAEFVFIDGASFNGLYTIGQPRVGDGKFARNFDNACLDRSFRFVNNNDVVTRVPVPGKIRDYTHVGRELYFDNEGNLWDSISRGEKFWDRLQGIVDDIGEKGLDGLKDHSSDEYVKLVDNNRTEKTIWS